MQEDGNQLHPWTAGCHQAKQFMSFCLFPLLVYGENLCIWRMALISQTKKLNVKQMSIK